MSATTKWSPPIYLTSCLYPLVEVESIIGGALNMLNAPFYQYREGTTGFAPALVSGTLTSVLLTYDDGLPESTQSGPVLWVSGDLNLVLLTYNNYPPESTQSGPVLWVSGDLEVVLITYNNYPTESTQSGPVLWVSGTLV